jgi:hypothetical protein
MALGQIEDALDCCVRCLGFDPHNKAVEMLRDKASVAKAEKDMKERERLERIQKEDDANRLLNTAFQVSAK